MNYCTNCGNKIFIGSKYCGMCGNKIDSEPNDDGISILNDDSYEILENNTYNDETNDEKLIPVTDETNMILENESMTVKYTFLFIIINLFNLFLLWGSINGILNILFYYFSSSTLIFILPTMFIAISLRRFIVNKKFNFEKKDNKTTRIIQKEIVINCNNKLN